MYQQATNWAAWVIASYENSIVISVEKSIVFPQFLGLLKTNQRLFWLLLNPIHSGFFVQSV
jgi:hypothetical protein